MRGAALIVVLTVLAGCSGEDAATTAVEPGTTPTVAPTHQTPTAMEPGTTPAVAGRLAPPQRVRALRFDLIRVFPSASGDFAGQASMTNTGRANLSALVVYWKVRDASGKVLDLGRLEWPSLEPRETATIELTGTAPYTDDWSKVTFDWALGGAGP
jgi:hypothetical protein